MLIAAGARAKQDDTKWMKAFLRKIKRLDFAERFAYIGVAIPGFVPNFFRFTL
jgi:hypothetical protein